MNEKKAPPAARVTAASCLLDRGWGKPTQPHSGDEDAPPIQLIKRVILDNTDDTDGTGIPPAS